MGNSNACGIFKRYVNEGENRNILSHEFPVTGGAVQGSVLGVMDHNAVMEFVNKGLDESSYKHVDDLTVQETIDKNISCTIDSSGNRPIHTFKPLEVQGSLDVLTENCLTKDLKINDKKTQLLSVPVRDSKRRHGSHLKTAHQCTQRIE